MDAGARITNVTGSPDGKWCISATTNGRVTVWSTQDHEKVTEIYGHTNVVCAVDVSPDSTKIATGSHDETVCVWDISSGDRLLGPLKHENNVAAVKFSPSGEFIATATWWHNSVRIYNQNGRLLIEAPITVNSPLNQSLAWSPNGEHLFALSYNGKISCLDVHTGTLLSQWPIHSSDNPRCIALASNGKFLAASANSSVSFWDLTTYQQIGSILEHADAVYCMALSADNSCLASGGPDKKITLQSLRSILPQSHFVDVSVLNSEMRPYSYLGDYSRLILMSGNSDASKGRASVSRRLLITFALRIICRVCLLILRLCIPLTTVSTSQGNRESQSRSTTIRIRKNGTQQTTRRSTRLSQ